MNDALTSVDNATERRRNPRYRDDRPRRPRNNTNNGERQPRKPQAEKTVSE